MIPPNKDEPLIISKEKWTKICLAASIMTISLYLIAMIFSLCGSSYFILNYQNTQMDRIQEWLVKTDLLKIVHGIFLTINFSICLTFILNKQPKWYYIVGFYATIEAIFYIFRIMDTYAYSAIGLVLYLTLPIIECRSKYLKSLIRVAIVLGVTLILEAMIFVIKSGYFDGKNHLMTLSATFVYAIENDIALSIVLYTISLFLNREKGDGKLWTVVSQPHGGSSQTSMTTSQPSLQKNLTKKQKNKIRLIYARVYAIQLGTFLIVMVLPFLLGKVFEFLVMYLAFAITRYILGFKYSLHFKKESLCVSASLIIFGILSLAVPFFYVVMIFAISIGIGLAVLLHLSYKYNSLWLFQKVSKVDKFATLYAFFDGDLSELHIKTICRYKCLDHFQSSLIFNFMRGEKISYLAFKFNYSHRMLIYKLDESIDKLLA